MFRIFLPAFGSEGSRVLAPYIRPAVHSVYAIGNHRALLDIDWGLVVSATADW